MDDVTFVDFSRFESAFVHGWSIPETTGRWTIGREARLAWRLEGEQSDLVCRINLIPALYAAHPQMSIEVWANDMLVTEWYFAYGDPLVETRAIYIPVETLRNRRSLTISFVVLQPIRPADVGASQDTRELGLHIRALTFVPLRSDNGAPCLYLI
jgi:hypothetical protein